ncbi:hypothetical protein [Sphingomonas abietis]|uniref:YubB ferredoxin-like domain-containing protein n=1 Tax=Sphingomonas abietis TaxID=3012344 RepID=A0ABY7NJP6_9SPHN|nr:hypothetical protein [Sphingomonas abietis]WBO21744.1 hypothetical protein PBT88_16455 [Sphingomonas abietis]
MADYFVQTCFAFDCSNDEAALLAEARQVATDLFVGFDPAPRSEAFGAVFPATIEGDWKSGFLELFDDPRFPEFGADISVADCPEALRSRRVTISGRRDFQFDAIAALIQRCCKTSLAAAPVTFEWGYSCNQARLDGFGGGWCVVFADRIRSGTTADAIDALINPAHEVANDTTSVWDEDPDHPVADWQYEVANGDTRLGYHGWIAGRRQNDGQAADDR